MSGREKCSWKCCASSTSTKKMGLVFLVLPKELLHGLQKPATHLGAKGRLSIVSSLNCPPVKPGGLFSRFHVVMSKTQRPVRTQPVPLHHFFNKKHELCCLVASGTPGPVGGSLMLASLSSACILQPLVLLSTHEHPGKTGRYHCSHSADREQRGFSKAKVAVMGLAVSESCQELDIPAT